MASKLVQERLESDRAASSSERGGGLEDAVEVAPVERTVGLLPPEVQGEPATRNQSVSCTVCCNDVADTHPHMQY